MPAREKATYCSKVLQAKIVYESLLCNLSEPEITTILNEWRAGQQPTLPALSPSAVHRFISNDDVHDVLMIWGIAWLSLARQWKATIQIRPLQRQLFKHDCAEARQCILEVAGADEHIEDAAEEEVDQLILQAVLFPSQTLSVTLPHW